MNSSGDPFMKLLFPYIALLNLVDGILTFIGLQLNFIDESNPLMQFLYSADPYLFLAVKVALSLLLVSFVVLKKLPTSSLVKRLSIFACFGYTLVMCIHCYWIVDSVTIL